MKICVTGGHGFIGRAACRKLAASGHSVTVLDIQKPLPTQPWASASVVGDIRDLAACRRAFAGCDRVLHLAAAHQDFGITDAEYFDVNQRGTATVCDAMAREAVDELCLYSSVAVYGAAAKPRAETTTPMPSSSYGASKLAAEIVAQQWVAGDLSRRCLIMRPTVVFGPESVANMHALMRQIYRKRFVLIGNGCNIKSLACVDNVVAATLFLWGLQPDCRPRELPDRCNTFNYVDQPDLSVAQIVDAIHEAFQRPRPTVRIPLWLGLLAAIPFDLAIALTGRNLPISSARIRKLATATEFQADKVHSSGFLPPLTLREGIAQMADTFVPAQG